MGIAALMVMDVQNGIVDRVADQSDALLERTRQAVDAARASGVPVVFVRVAFRDPAVEISSRNKAFGALGARGGMGIDDPATQIHPAVAPLPDEAVVVKKRVSAFAGSDLDVVLRSLGATSLVLAGIATSGVVLSTLRVAADLDFGLTVLSDACADGDPEVHRVLLEKVFPRQADVVTTAEWIASL